MNEMITVTDLPLATRPLRLGFLGVGWIGRHRMKAILDTGLAQAIAVADPSSVMRAEALKLAPDTALLETIDAVLEHELDGLVIATPSAQHARQSITALKAGVAVFCQKPLGRDAGEVKTVIEAAEAADRLLGVDLSYRHTAGMQLIREHIRNGELGDVFGADLTFHNAYGPDKPWFYDKQLSGGGCLMDLGVHLIDMALWSLDFPRVTTVEGRLLADGRPLLQEDHAVEDYAIATLTTDCGTAIRIACSWRLHAGRDAVIDASFYGTKGGISMANVSGSFYDFTTERFQGTARQPLQQPPEDWGGRGAAAWVRKLATSRGFDPECKKLIDVAEAMDRIYGR
ncbi:Gfo/Idh/MocA family protein [Pararhizobium arenae]|uniref:Gfo/Idh/MocA family protein n=1 Tax=Pararhizobium arenae TaxID=1856850 RepID=UPI00094B6819|nr:Gfo/Idh/MocA family oxidoreductase [Pararhizobium arenae]